MAAPTLLPPSPPVAPGPPLPPPATPARPRRSGRSLAARLTAAGLAAAVAVAAVAGWVSATAYDGDRVRDGVGQALASPAVQRELVAGVEQATDDAIDGLGEQGVVRAGARAVGSIDDACGALADADPASGPAWAAILATVTGTIGDLCRSAIDGARDRIAGLRAGVVGAAGRAAAAALERPAVRGALAAGTERLHGALLDGGAVVIPLEPVLRDLGDRTSLAGVDPATAWLIGVAVDRTLDAVDLPAVRVQLESDGGVPWLWRARPAVGRIAVGAAVAALALAVATVVLSGSWRPALRRTGTALAAAAPLGVLCLWVVHTHATALGSPLLAGAARATLMTALPSLVVVLAGMVLAGSALVLAAGRNGRPAERSAAAQYRPRHG